MRISGMLTKLTLDQDAFLKKLDDSVTEMQESAASEFLLAAQERIPVLTGQAKSTLAPLARELGILDQFDFSPDSPHIDQKEALEAQGQTRSRGESRGSYSFERDDRGVYTLTLSTNLGYYDFWEVNPSSRGRGEWLSLPEGRQWYTKYIREHGSEHLRVFEKPSPFRRTKVSF